MSEQAGVNVAKILEPRFSGLGSVVGKLEVISVHGPPRFNVYDALTKRAVRCRFAPERLDDVAAALGRRVVVRSVAWRVRSIPHVGQETSQARPRDCDHAVARARFRELG